MAPQKVATDREWLFLGRHLQEVRLAKGYATAGALADRLKLEPECGAVTRSTVARWECGGLRPNLPQSLALETVLKVPVRKWYEVAAVELEAEAPEPDLKPAPTVARALPPAPLLHPAIVGKTNREIIADKATLAKTEELKAEAKRLADEYMARQEAGELPDPPPLPDKSMPGRRVPPLIPAGYHADTTTEPPPPPPDQLKQFETEADGNRKG
jgi:transcriptional regulator with XRE-family HTH domain